MSTARHTDHAAPPQPDPAQAKPAVQPRRRTGPWWYHNTSQAAWEAIQRDGMDAGSFSNKPIDFGGQVWLKVRQSDIPTSDRPAMHQYGKVVALEPHWEWADPERHIRHRIPKEAIRMHRAKKS